jgi:GH25 family lysozyme M1 (1,4-beta-N-acetylmuramidase)
MIRVIDVSKWQSPSQIDYDKLASEVDGVILRACYGKYKDTAFLTHARELALRGVPLGAYQFITQYNSVLDQVLALSEQLKELETVVDLGNGFGMVVEDLQLGIWADVENEAGATPLTKTQVSDYIDQVEARIGFEVGIYTSRYYWDEIMKTDAYKSRKLWVAHYGATTPYLPATGGWDSWWLWQYTSNGSYDGYPGSIDSNHFYGDESDFADWIGEDLPPVIDPPEPLYQAEIVNCIALNVRSGPGVSYDIVETLYDGDIVNVYKEQSGWLHIEAGWISAAYTAIYEPPVVVEPSDAEKLQMLWDAHPELH